MLEKLVLFLFTSNFKMLCAFSFEIIFFIHTVLPIDNVRYLGLLIDSTYHASNVNDKVAKGLALMKTVFVSCPASV